MKAIDANEWGRYVASEMDGVRAILSSHGYTLDPQQVHIGGERHLMSGRKLVLTGTAPNGKRVVIKVSSHPAGIAEINNEHALNQRLHRLSFAHYTFHTPEEIAYIRESGFTILVTAFIEQTHALLSLSLTEQFFIALRALEMLEGAHVVARTHLAEVGRIFTSLDADTYLSQFSSSKSNIRSSEYRDSQLDALLEKAHQFLEANRSLLTQYCGFLTHTDLAPHNMRIGTHRVHLLDAASLCFGNKHDGWARFLNFMALHNPALEQSLLSYLRDNRTEEEYLSVRLMRIYKVVYLIEYYIEAHGKSEGALRELSHARIIFWSALLRALVDDTSLPDAARQHYLDERTRLRSDEETARQAAIFGTS